MAVRHDHYHHGRPDSPVCPLLPFAPRPRPALLRFLSGLHGFDARRGALGQSDSIGRVLGTDQPVIIHADRLLASQAGRAPRSAHVAGHHRRRRPVPAGRHADAGPHRGQLRPGYRPGFRRPDTRSPLVHHDAGADRPGRLDQKRAISLSCLAAQRHGGAHAGIGLFALRHHGQGRRLLAGALLASHGRHAGMDLDHRRGRLVFPGAGRLRRHLPARHERGAGLFHHQPSGPDYAAAGHE